MSVQTIALLGQPNSGKSTLFNGLTGSKQHIGNWPGKTVERKDGIFIHKNKTYKVVDLPGTYGLSANSEEEVVTRNYIAGGEADLVCILADASQLGRSLFMLADYAGIQVPAVLLLNMMDVAAGQGKEIDTASLERMLGIPVIPMIAADKRQYGTFMKALENCEYKASVLKFNKLENIYLSNIKNKYNEIKKLLPNNGIGIYSPFWLAAKLLEQDKQATALVKEHIESAVFQQIEIIMAGVQDGNLLTADCKFQWIDGLLEANVTSTQNQFSRSSFDQAATSKRWGKPIAIGMIVLGLIVSMVIGFPLMGLFSALISTISGALAQWLLGLGAAPFVVSLLCNGILTAVSFALQMASYVFGISLVFGLLEDVGYMARISYVFDNTMTKIGLQGKAIMPFLVSFGCNIGGIAGARVIDSWGQRVMTIALSWVIPCASTWGVVGLVSGTFFGSKSIIVVLSLFAAAFLHIIITYKLFSRSLNKQSEQTGFIMELPPYHKPHWKSLFGSVFHKMGSVLKRALCIIICISVVFWFLSYTPDGNVANSIIYRVGTFIEPVTRIVGLPWQLFIAFAASTMGKEAALGVMASLFNTSGIWTAIEGSGTVNTATLGTNLLVTISQPEALAFLFAFFFNMPCLMALSATAQETHSMKWTIRIAAYYIFSALLLGAIAYRVGLIIF
ncbi:MAG: ferrous iron transport protein B [Lachnospiraceae bacterium]